MLPIGFHLLLLHLLHISYLLTLSFVKILITFWFISALSSQSILKIYFSTFFISLILLFLSNWAKCYAFSSDNFFYSKNSSFNKTFIAIIEPASVNSNLELILNNFNNHIFINITFLYWTSNEFSLTFNSVDLVYPSPNLGLSTNSSISLRDSSMSYRERSLNLLSTSY